MVASVYSCVYVCAQACDHLKTDMERSCFIKQVVPIGICHVVINLDDIILVCEYKF